MLPQDKVMIPDAETWSCGVERCGKMGNEKILY